MAAPPLPNQFFVFFPQRKAKTDPFSGFVLLEQDLPNPHHPNAIQLKYPPKSKDIYELKGPLTDTKGSYFGFYSLMGPVDSAPPALQDMARMCSGIIIVKKGTTTRIPVFKFNDITRRFDGVLKRNVKIELVEPVIAHVSPSPATFAVQPSTKLKKVPVLKMGDLHPFVAKQLLELAQIKKEMCPITAEEYITGETAVMPCGHLFMKIAITETFKKDPGRCPACRQSGYPTHV